MSDTEISKDGVFVDLKSGKVVEGAPEEGVQLIPPGSEITPDMKNAVEAARAAAGPDETADAPKDVETAVAVHDETADAPKDVETAVKPKSK